MVGPFQAAKMVLGPNQAAFLVGPKMLPNLVLGPFLASTKTAMIGLYNEARCDRNHSNKAMLAP